VVDACEGGFRAANLVGVREMIENLRRIMFPGFFDPDPLWDGEIEAHITRLCERVSRTLREEVRAVLRYGRRRTHTDRKGANGAGPDPLSDEAFTEHVVCEFLRSLPRVRAMLGLDVQAAYDGDPAAEHTDEIVLCYPGLDAIFTHRAAHELYKLGVPVLPRVISEQAHSRTGIDVHPGAQIGESFFIDHGSATVIGETSIIGKQVKVYQGVTLGARSFPKDERGRAIRGIKRHPTIGDRVTIYAGAVILGGDTVIGDDCVIAGGVFVTSSVAPGHVVQQTRPEPVLKPTGGAKVDESKRKAAESRVDLGWLADGAGI
jgi:serine O-acetyltransferase